LPTSASTVEQWTRIAAVKRQSASEPQNRATALQRSQVKKMEVNNEASKPGSDSSEA
jgi:hypothetical protein